MSKSNLPWQIAEKASSDPKFREELLRDAKAAIEKAFPSAQIPQGAKVTVLEQTPEQVYVVLPMGGTGRELSDESLEKVAGGVCFFTV